MAARSAALLRNIRLIELTLGTVFAVQVPVTKRKLVKIIIILSID